MTSNQKRIHNLISYVNKHETEDTPATKTCFIQYDKVTYQYKFLITTRFKPVGIVYMSIEVAKELVKKLNNNEIYL